MNTPTTLQHCMMAIFFDIVEKYIEEFIDYFLVFGDSFDNYLEHLSLVLQNCKEMNMVINWEKCHFIVNEGIVLRHMISSHVID